MSHRIPDPLRSALRQHSTCCESTSVAECGCSMILPSPPRVALNGTKFQKRHEKQGKLCDSIVFWYSPSTRQTFAATVELKSGRVPAKAVEQLQEGAKVVESLSQGIDLMFAAVLARRRRVHPEDYKVIMRKRVRFRSRQYPVLLVSCGSRLADVFPSTP
jgi:hypothetical protein